MKKSSLLAGLVLAPLLLLPGVRARASDLSARYASSLLIVAGDLGQGSGSIINYRGNSLIVTNAHVLSGHSSYRFRRLDGRELRPSVFGIAADRDLLVARQETVSDGIPASESVEKDAAIGDAVVVLGNSQGSNVVTEIEGTIIGLGPDLLEVDAKFVTGNSGSPIIHVKSGKVIAIATFVTVREPDVIASDSKFTEVRRFGYRLDTVANWEFRAPAQLRREGVQVRAIQRKTNDLVALARDVTDGSLDRAQHTRRGNWVAPYVAIMGQGWPTGTGLKGASYNSGGIEQTKYINACKDFTSQINRDLTLFPDQLTAYHRAIYQEEYSTRQALSGFFARLLWDQVRFNDVIR